MKMTQEELTAKIEAHTKWLKTRFSDHVEGIRANLTYVDLTGANLTGADLTYADLTGANLAYVDLTGANLAYVDLTGANLTGANLNIFKASPYVYDALAASLAAQLAMKKTRIEWEEKAKPMPKDPATVDREERAKVTQTNKVWAERKVGE